MHIRNVVLVGLIFVSGILPASDSHKNIYIKDNKRDIWKGIIFCGIACVMSIGVAHIPGNSSAEITRMGYGGAIFAMGLAGVALFQIINPSVLIVNEELLIYEQVAYKWTEIDKIEWRICGSRKPFLNIYISLKNGIRKTLFISDKDKSLEEIVSLILNFYKKAQDKKQKLNS